MTTTEAKLHPLSLRSKWVAPRAYKGSHSSTPTDGPVIRHKSNFPFGFSCRNSWCAVAFLIGRCNNCRAHTTAHHYICRRFYLFDVAQLHPRNAILYHKCIASPSSPALICVDFTGGWIKWASAVLRATLAWYVPLIFLYIYALTHSLPRCANIFIYNALELERGVRSFMRSPSRPLEIKTLHPLSQHMARFLTRTG